MDRKRAGNRYFLAAALVVSCVWFPRDGSAKDESAGFYAGPLSAVVETVVEKAKPALKPEPQPSSEAVKKPRQAAQPPKERLKETDEESPLSPPS